MSYYVRVRVCYKPRQTWRVVVDLTMSQDGNGMGDAGLSDPDLGGRWISDGVFEMHHGSNRRIHFANMEHHNPKKTRYTQNGIQITDEKWYQMCKIRSTSTNSPVWSEF